MNVRGSVLAGSLLLVSLVGCDKLKEKLGKSAGDMADAAVAAIPSAMPDTDASAAMALVTDAAAAPMGALVGTNADKVARFGAETPVPNLPATILIPVANVRVSPPNGDIVTTLPRNTLVTQISQQDKYFLCVFDNPKNTAEKLEGWVVKDAFVTPPTTDAGLTQPTLSCPAGQSLLLADTAFCGKMCKTDRDCAAREICSGRAYHIQAGKPAEAVTSCVLQTFPPPAQPSMTPDGGATKPGIVIPGPEEMGAPANHACPTAYAYVAADNKCHKSCQANPGACLTSRCTAKCNVGMSVCVHDANVCK